MADRCAHWRNMGHPDGGRCALFQKTVSFGVCRQCEHQTAPGWARALARKLQVGTIIKNTTGAVGLKPCTGCKKRANWMDGV